LYLSKLIHDILTENRRTTF